MILHTVRTILIGDFSEMLLYNDLNKLKRVDVWVSKKRLEKQYKELMYAFNEINSKDKLERSIEQNKHRLSSLIQINIHYPILVKMLKLTAKYDLEESREGLLSVYEMIYKKKPKTQKDYDRIIKDLQLRVRKYKQRYGTDQEEEKEDMDFEKLLIEIESILAPVTIRDKRLYTLPKYIELASKKADNGRN